MDVVFVVVVVAVVVVVVVEAVVVLAVVEVAVVVIVAVTVVVVVVEVVVVVVALVVVTVVVVVVVAVVIVVVVRVVRQALGGKMLKTCHLFCHGAAANTLDTGALVSYNLQPAAVLPKRALYAKAAQLCVARQSTAQELADVTPTTSEMTSCLANVPVRGSSKRCKAPPTHVVLVKVVVVVVEEVVDVDVLVLVVAMLVDVLLELAVEEDMLVDVVVVVIVLVLVELDVVVKVVVEDIVTVTATWPWTWPQAAGRPVASNIPAAAAIATMPGGIMAGGSATRSKAVLALRVGKATVLVSPLICCVARAG